MKTGSQNSKGETVMKKSMKNKGFSLVELIVVIAIMGVMMAVGGYALTAISSANAKECAREMEAALVATRTQCYSSDSATSVAEVSFYKGSDGIYMLKNYEGTAEKIGGSKVSVSYRLTGAAAYTDLGTQKITFSFNRSSGAFRSMKLDGNTAGMCESIKIVSGHKTYTITCYEQTGKTMIE